MDNISNTYDAIIIGGGAAGLMCGATASQHGKKVLILEKANKVGKKILISGGGKCNFTNLEINSQNYISHNPHFCKSALSRYSQWDIIALLQKYNLSFYEKTLGQLFCHEKSKAVLDMLIQECKNVTIQTNAKIINISHNQKYIIQTSQGKFISHSLVIATGGPSIPKMGASDFALNIAQQFGVNYFDFTPALVPLTLSNNDTNRYFKDLSGTAIEVSISIDNISFRENMLITHFGISGPAILQISSYWQQGKIITINLLPDINASDLLTNKQQIQGKTQLKTVLHKYFSKRLAQQLADSLIHKKLANITLGEINTTELQHFGSVLNNLQLCPTGTQGLRVAEVCSGGIDTNDVSSKTMEVKNQQGLYFIGESLDVTGWLGGYNFQWAWSSGVACGKSISLNH